MKSVGLLGLFLFVTQLHAAKNSYFIENPSHDVIIRYSKQTHSEIFSNGNPKANKDLKECRLNIAKAVCWVDPAPWGLGSSRPCLAGSEKFIAAFEGHFDRSSELIQRMYCHVDKIWVEKELDSTAYASPIYDRNHQMVGGGVGIRQEVLESPLSFGQWLSWKEETSFGGGLKSTGSSLNLIKYVSNKTEREFFLDYVMNHEFGHLFDFANDVNNNSADSWTNISWYYSTPKKKYDYPLRDRLCYYSCHGDFLDRKDAAVLFSGLLKTNFLSTYASRHPSEDWAETFAHYIAANELGLKYQVDIEGQSFDMTAHFQSPLLKEKRDYVENFIKSKILYPGEKAVLPTH